MKKIIQYLLVFAIYTNLVSGQDRSNISSGNLSIESTTTACETITESGYQNDGWGVHPPEGAFDGDPATKWTVEGTNEWIQVEYCTAKLIKEVLIDFPAKSGRKYKFSIDVSSDGATYTQVYENLLAPAGAILLCDFPDVTAKYVRINAKGNSDGGLNWNNYTEIIINIPSSYTIRASTDDAYILKDQTVVNNKELLVGDVKVGVDGSSNDILSHVSTVIPFQLPPRSASNQTLVGAKLKLYVSYGHIFTEEVDFYGLKNRSTSTVLGTDFYDGEWNVCTDYKLKEKGLSKNNPRGIKDIARFSTSSTYQVDLVNYIKDQYDNQGANDGDWIFIRLSVPTSRVTPYDKFFIDGSDGNIVKDFNQYSLRAEADRHPPTLELDYANTVVDLSTTWNGTWSNGIPTQHNKAIIESSINVGSSGDIKNIVALDIEVKNAAIVNVSSGGNIVIKSDIDIKSGGSVIVKSGGSLKLETGCTSTINGTYTVERTARPSTHNYTYWSSPVDATVETALIATATGTPKVYKYTTGNFDDADNDGEDDDRNDWELASGTMVAGKGYIAKASDDEVETTQTAVFTAVSEINKGEVKIALELSGDAGGDADDNLDDWNLVGNPYSTAIWAKAFINYNNIKMYGTLYFWTHGTPIDGNGYYSGNDYANYNLSGGTAAISGGKIPSGDIASGQGFFVEALLPGDIYFLPGMQILTVEDAINNNFYKKEILNDDGLIIEDRIWFNVENDDSFSQILVGFFDEATDGLDNGYDGKRLDVGNNISFYSITENQQLAIQGRSSFIGNEVITLGYNANVSSETTFNISVERMEGLISDPNISVLLKDKYLGVSHNLKSSDYPFTVEKSGTYNDRFEIVFTSGTLANDTETLNSNISVYPNPTTNSFSVDLEDVNKVLLYNTAGIKVFESAQQDIYNISSLPKGVYLVKAITENNNIVTSKLVKN